MIKPASPALAGRFFTPEPPEKPYVYFTTVRKIKVGMEMSPTSLGYCERKKRVNSHKHLKRGLHTGAVKVTSVFFMVIVIGQG